MYQIALIERYLHSCLFWQNLEKNNRMPGLSVEELLKKYQGFEGELIACSSVHENKDVIEEERAIYKLLKLRNSNDDHMLYISTPYFEGLPLLLKEKALRVGFDVGVFEDDKTIYSSIFNEILFGHLSELIVFKNLLNENLLFPDRQSAEEYVNFHNQLSIQGKGVEDYEEMKVYEILKQKS